MGFSIAGLILSIMGVRQAKKSNQKLIGLGIAGIVLSSIFIGKFIYGVVALGILIALAI